MPVADTELLFLLNPRDPRHGHALNIIERLRNRLYVPDTALLEFEITLRSKGRSESQVIRAFMSLKKIFINYGIKEVHTLGSDIIIHHLDLMRQYGLSYFDSLIAASAMYIDGIIVSDDNVFDFIDGLKRIPIVSSR